MSSKYIFTSFYLICSVLLELILCLTQPGYPRLASAFCPHHSLAVTIESATPALLETGLTQGVALDHLYVLTSLKSRTIAHESQAQRDPSCQPGWRWLGGTRLSYRVAQESSKGWQVDHNEWRIGAQTAIVMLMGRGALGLSLGVGGAYVSEEQTRHQARRLDTQELRSTIHLEDIHSEARQWVTELTLSPLALVQLVEYSAGHVGLISAAEWTGRLLPDLHSDQVPSWGWGVRRHFLRNILAFTCINEFILVS